MRYARSGEGALVLAALLVAAGCAGRQHLSDYSYAGKSVAVVYDTPPAPILMSKYALHFLPPHERDPMSASSQALDARAQTGQRRVDSAAALVDFPMMLARNIAARAASNLGATLATSATSADYVLHVSANQVGLLMYQPLAPALSVDVESTLRDATSGRVIWRSTTRDQTPLTDFLARTGQRGAVSVSGVSVDQIPVAEYEQLLDQLARYSADRVTSDLHGTPAASQAMASTARQGTAPSGELQ